MCLEGSEHRWLDSHRNGDVLLEKVEVALQTWPQASLGYMQVIRGRSPKVVLSLSVSLSLFLSLPLHLHIHMSAHKNTSAFGGVITLSKKGHMVRGEASSGL